MWHDHNHWSEQHTPPFMTTYSRDLLKFSNVIVTVITLSIEAFFCSWSCVFSLRVALRPCSDLNMLDSVILFLVVLSIGGSILAVLAFVINYLAVLNLAIFRKVAKLITKVSHYTVIIHKPWSRQRGATHVTRTLITIADRRSIAMHGEIDTIEAVDSKRYRSREFRMK